MSGLARGYRAEHVDVVLKHESDGFRTDRLGAWSGTTVEFWIPGTTQA